MAPSMLKLGAVALAYIYGVSALSSSPVSSKTYQLSESYNSGNFLEKFTFFEGGHGLAKSDYNHGFVQYQSKDAAVSSGLIKTEGDDIRIGVDSKTTLGLTAGRKSVRLESTASYNTGLFIAKFNHFPKPVCGAWPAFWMVGDNWPQDGEVDIYEMWSMADHNRITYHTGTPEQVGECKIIDETHIESSETRNCDNYAKGQWTNEGCGVTEKKGQWGNPNGGVYAIEWTEDHLSVWSWPTEPTDIENGEPKPETWGMPHMSVTSKTCDVEKAFKNLRFILNINFCGDAAGQLFGADAKCGRKAESCNAYVAENPQEFEDVYWKIQYLDVYQLQQALPSTTSSAISSSTTSSAISSTETSSTVTSSFVSVVSSSAVNTDAVSTSAVSTSEAVSSSAAASSEVVSSSAVVSASAVPSSDILSNIVSATDAASSSGAVFVTATSSAALPTETDDDSDCEDDEEGDASSGIVVPSGSATVSIIPSGSAGGVSSGIVVPSGSVLPSASVTESGASSIITSAPTSGVPVISGVVSSDFPISSAPVDPSASGGFPVSSAISGPVLFPNSTITASQEYTTSTIFTTSYYTITSCAPTVTNCPAKVVTSVIAIATTVCPVTNQPAGPTNVPGGGNGVPVVPTQVPGGCNGVDCPVPTQVPGGPNNGAPGSGNGNGEVIPPVPTGGAPGSGSGNPPVVPVPSGGAPGTGSGNPGCTGENCPVPTGSTPGEGEVPAVPTGGAPVPSGSAPGTGSDNGNNSNPPFVPAPPAPTGTLPGGTNGAINGTYSIPPAPVASGTGISVPVPVASSSPSVSIGQPPIPTEEVPVTAGAGKTVLSVGVAVAVAMLAL
ncbi:hypothetical protein B0T20DRAFT_343923 [Sordaria brevicollis]|uniref:GH16 domain-containing protein n=1 Tax=Sordaria brevicollis TaxID=83679 RepID=A0AAE0PN65_SORBR|nr:hypothetical protein B0T20DRAFT_343923 [Sordaria brevicollis]